MDPYEFMLGSPYEADQPASEQQKYSATNGVGDARITFGDADAEEQYGGHNRDLCPACECSPCSDPAECEKWLNDQAAKVEASYLKGL